MRSPVLLALEVFVLEVFALEVVSLAVLGLEGRLRFVPGRDRKGSDMVGVGWVGLSSQKGCNFEISGTEKKLVSFGISVRKDCQRSQVAPRVQS